MTTTHETHAHPNYLAVFGALVVLTAISVTSEYLIGQAAGHVVNVLVAVCKAVLVAMFFMHLKYDWFKVYFMVVPTLIVGIVLVLTLMPDATFSQYRNVLDVPPPILAD
ncbi:MAG: cytochrome C oxidase subunit IV family protein [Gemmatales bacterium]|nr:cytochrome C oxidase subunit IV family protein [Gemmatales bacterium]MCS7159338.1 cytochrome C oxidase subunit IV family protein [Gemmatales bacterium]MDW8174538.1 cytochrome C oxidase subunit IV family protein [Gemmatales bacterium]MDW8221409.1 cytochrome C oxidase subunit IV family protein [Gemmatales bacterium]